MFSRHYNKDELRDARFFGRFASFFTLDSKAIRQFVGEDIPVIAGGLPETKAEVTAALGAGALAVSTGKRELWSL